MNIYKRKIKDIVDVLSDSAKTSNYNIGLLTGTTGMSLFFNVLAGLSNDNSPWNLSEQYINQTIDKLQKDGNPISTYCSGLAGISFVLSSGIVDLDDFEISEEIYKYLYVSLIAYLRQNNIDFLHGATGVMLGLLSSKNEMSNLAINNYVDYLWNTKEVINGLYRWKMMNTDEKIKYNISLSHGMSAIILVLVKILKLCSDEQKTKVELMITNSVNYVLSQEIDVNKYGSYYPSTSLDNVVDVVGSRLAWCYGDLGVCMALYQVGKIMNRQDWVDKALEALLYAANNRRDLPKNMVVDACICHGTAGIGQIFYRMWWNTRLPQFKAAADYWFDETLKMANFEDGPAKYKFHSIGYGYISNYCFLEGIAGIGLALTTYAYEIEPRWDECLLLS